MSGDTHHELRFPRWLEESKLPEALHERAGPNAWPVFRRLVEHEAERNVIPGRCVIDLERLARNTGLPLPEAAIALDELQEGGVLCVLESSPPNVHYEIPVPLPVPATEEDIRERLNEAGVDASHLYLRYARAVDHEDRYQRVIELYQALYGLRCTPKIAEILECIALECDVGDILQAFTDAHHAGKGFAWVKRRLKVG